MASPSTADHAETLQQTQWHALPLAEIEHTLQTGPDGLQAAEIQDRLARFGPNRLPPPKRRGPLLRLLLQFHNILLYIMIAAAAITAFLGHWLDTGVLLAAVIINAIIGFIQEGKAETALDSIRTLLSPHAVVIREGIRQEIDATELVPGDRVLLVSGDRVPADMRLISVKELQVEEAALTGESLPVQKQIEATQPDAPLGDRFNMAYSGTLVVYGQASGIVVATGSTTELGEINRLLEDTRRLSTPLLRQIDRFAVRLAVFILITSVITFLLGVLWRNYAPAEMFMMTVALIASAIPEELPAIMTVILALGVQRMARHKAIIRRLPAVEALGSVTIICSDKTGTLTRNEMTVQRVITAENQFAVSGAGYTPAGEFSMDGQIIDPTRYPALNLAIRTGVLCNDARLRKEHDQWQIEGDPTEGALLVLGEKTGFSSHLANIAWPRQDVIPFESQHSFMATYHLDSENESWIFVKGAPERILAMCTAQLQQVGEQPLNADYWQQQINSTAAQGLRLLALACKRSAPQEDNLKIGDIKTGFTLLALVGIIDPPRKEAIQAVAECHRAGIRVKMITGDHAETARAVGAQLGIGQNRPVLTGTEITAMDDEALRGIVMEVDIFARTSPEHKLRLVQALQASHQVVAMTGDGVNDAPALKRADVGVAMGLKGTEAAREAADMVLADDNFATIAHAVREGRAIYDNLKKFILFILPTNGGEALVVIAAMLFELTLPLTPVQILWINMVTTSALGLALAFEPAEHNIMHRGPRPPGEALLSGFFIWRVLMVSVLMMAVTLGLFLWELENGTPIDTARTISVNAIVLMEMFYLINSRHIFAPLTLIRGMAGNRYILLAIAACMLLQIAYTHLPAMQTIFKSTNLSVLEWCKSMAAGLVVFYVIELEKLIIRYTRITPASTVPGHNISPE